MIENKLRYNSKVYLLSGRTDEAKPQCQKGLAINDNKFYNALFQCYQNYFETNDIKTLCRLMSRVYQRFEDELNIYQKEDLSSLLSKLYSMSGQYKKAYEWSSKLYTMTYY